MGGSTYSSFASEFLRESLAYFALMELMPLLYSARNASIFSFSVVVFAGTVGSGVALSSLAAG